MSRIRFILLLTLIPGFFCWPALAAPVSFSKEIKPLLNKSDDASLVGNDFHRRRHSGLASSASCGFVTAARFPLP